MFDHLLESSHRDDSNKWSNIGFGKEITQIESIEVHFTHLIWISGFFYFYGGFSRNLKKKILEKKPHQQMIPFDK